jgi:hypothetical protein
MTRRGGGDGVRAPLKFIFAAERKWRGSVFAGRDCESAEKNSAFCWPVALSAHLEYIKISGRQCDVRAEKRLKTVSKTIHHGQTAHF